jgi:hypothetical protein
MRETFAPNNSQATRDGRSSSAFAVDITRPAWLSSGRWRLDTVNK